MSGVHIWQTSIPIDEDVFALIARATPIGASGGGRDNDDDHRAAHRLVVKGNAVERIRGGFIVERYRDSMDRMAGVRECPERSATLSYIRSRRALTEGRAGWSRGIDMINGSMHLSYYPRPYYSIERKESAKMLSQDCMLAYRDY